MENDKLKPCPLCGNASNFAVLDDKHEPLYRRLVCNNCHASIADVKGNDPAKRWNTRPIEDALHARIAELETEKECEMRVIKDGNAWCFVLPDFQNLQVSPSFWMKEGVLDKIYKELRSGRDE